MALGEYTDDDDSESTYDSQSGYSDSSFGDSDFDSYLTDPELTDSEDEENINYSTVWTEEPPQGFSYAPFPFTGPKPGPTQQVRSPLEAFELYLTDDIVQVVLDETNRVLNANENQADLISKDELYVFIAVWILAEIHGKPTMEDNWSTEEFLHTPIFAQLMSLERWNEISDNLHFCNHQTESSGNDEFWKMRKVFEMFNSNFSKAFNMAQNITVDDSVGLWAGHQRLDRYLPENADEWDFRFWAIGEPQSGYISRLLVDEGEQTKFDSEDSFGGLQPRGKNVMQLVAPYFGLGHILTLNKFFTDIVLFKYLVQNKISCVGSLRKGIRYVPQEISKATFQRKDRGKAMWRYTEDFVSFCYMGDYNMRFLSSFQTMPEMSGPRKSPGVMQIFYNAGMPLMELEMSRREEKSSGRPYQEIFYYLLQISLVNAHILLRASKASKMKVQDFRAAIVRSLVERHSTVRI